MTYLSIVLLGLLNFVCGFAAAETLTAVQDPVDWKFAVICFAVGAVAVGLVWLVKNRPGAVGRAKAETATVADALHRLVQTHAEAVAKIPAQPAVDVIVPTEPEPLKPAGKNGVAGDLTLTLTGDPKADLEAFTAAYYRA